MFAEALSWFVSESILGTRLVILLIALKVSLDINGIVGQANDVGVCQVISMTLCLGLGGGLLTSAVLGTQSKILQTNSLIPCYTILPVLVRYGAPNALTRRVWATVVFYAGVAARSVLITEAAFAMKKLSPSFSGELLLNLLNIKGGQALLCVCFSHQEGLAGKLLAMVNRGTSTALVTSALLTMMPANFEAQAAMLAVFIIGIAPDPITGGAVKKKVK